tara:strand:+ start:250 stop:651 length:402 start_codon:yes stop_codon:yes gene_type:complete
MGYKMRSSISGLLGINEKFSTPDVPVFEKNLSDSWGYADMDRTITINSKLNEKQKADAVEHEREHVLQMRKGEAWYDQNNIYHKPKNNEAIQVYKRVGEGMIVKGMKMELGDPNNPIEKPVYEKTKTYPTKLS